MGREDYGIASCVACCIFVICAPLAITSIALSVQNGGVCDNLDVGTNLTVAKWLLGSGVASLIVTFFLCTSVFFMMTGSVVAKLFAIVITIINTLFGLAWFIVGAFVLFRSNIDCIHEGVTYVSFALAMWCISAFFIFVSLVNMFRDRPVVDI